MITPAGYSATVNAPMRGSSEFTTSNSKQRLLVKVQIWGDVNSPGVYYVPDITSLIELISLAGGPVGSIDDLEVKASRKILGKKALSETFEGEEFLTSVKAGKWVMQPDDVVYVQAQGSTEGLLKTLSIVSAITGTITSVALVMFLANDNK